MVDAPPNLSVLLLSSIFCLHLPGGTTAGRLQLTSAQSFGTERKPATNDRRTDGQREQVWGGGEGEGVKHRYKYCTEHNRLCLNIDHRCPCSGQWRCGRGGTPTLHLPKQNDKGKHPAAPSFVSTHCCYFLRTFIGNETFVSPALTRGNQQEIIQPPVIYGLYGGSLLETFVLFIQSGAVFLLPGLQWSRVCSG